MAQTKIATLGVLEKYTALVKSQLANKVDKEAGKVLSDNNYTTTEKNKLAGIAEGAEVNVIESVKVNGTALTATDKAVNVVVPTKISDLTNDSSFATTDDLDGYVEKVEGKGLSTNDLTDALKATYDAAVEDIDDLVAAGAEANKIDSITLNGTTVTPDVNKNVALVISNKLSTYDNDAGFLTASDIANKVDAVEGKGLSTNDYTTTEKNKLAGIDEGAEVNVIETVKVDNVALTVTDKAVNIDLSGKVDVVSGKGLSTNDYTTTEKDKLAGIAEGADVNVIETVKVNGTAATVTDKAVDITVPTSLSQLSNTTTKFQSEDEVNALIASAVGGITSFETTVVESLPATGTKGYLYLMAATGASGQNIYEEYIWIENKYEMLGTTEMDLSDYAKTADFVEITEAEVNALWAD